MLPGVTGCLTASYDNFYCTTHFEKSTNMAKLFGASDLAMKQFREMQQPLRE